MKGKKRKEKVGSFFFFSRPNAKGKKLIVKS